MLTAICLAALTAISQPTFTPGSKAGPETVAPKAEVRFKPGSGERLRYHLKGDSVNSGFGGKANQRPTKYEANLLLTVKEHTRDQITAEMRYERIKLSAGEGETAFVYDSGEPAKDGAHQIAAKWVKPLLEQKFTVKCDGHGELQDVEGMSPNIFEAMKGSPLTTEEGTAEIRKLGVTAAGIATEVVKLKSGQMGEVLSFVFKPGAGVPDRVRPGDTWDHKEARLTFTVESLKADSATIRFAGSKDAPHPEGEETDTAGRIVWSTASGTLVRAESSFRVLKSGGGAGSFAEGDKEIWQLERLPEQAAK